MTDLHRQHTGEYMFCHVSIWCKPSIARIPGSIYFSMVSIRCKPFEATEWDTFLGQLSKRVNRVPQKFEEWVCSAMGSNPPSLGRAITRPRLRACTR